MVPSRSRGRRVPLGSSGTRVRYRAGRSRRRDAHLPHRPDGASVRHAAPSRSEVSAAAACSSSNSGPSREATSWRGGRHGDVDRGYRRRVAAEHGTDTDRRLARPPRLGAHTPACVSRRAAPAAPPVTVPRSGRGSRLTSWPGPQVSNVPGSDGGLDASRGPAQRCQRQHRARDVADASTSRAHSPLLKMEDVAETSSSSLRHPQPQSQHGRRSARRCGGRQPRPLAKCGARGSGAAVVQALGRAIPWSASSNPAAMLLASKLPSRNSSWK